MSKFDVMKEKFSTIYKLYVQKAERKQRTKQEVDTIILWLTDYKPDELEVMLNSESTLEEFLNNIPAMNSKADLIKGKVCGIRVEDIQDPLTKKMRYLDKLIDELAKGYAMEKILRS